MNMLFSKKHSHDLISFSSSALFLLQQMSAMDAQMAQQLQAQQMQQAQPVGGGQMPQVVAQQLQAQEVKKTPAAAATTLAQSDDTEKDAATAATPMEVEK